MVTGGFYTNECSPAAGTSSTRSSTQIPRGGLPRRRSLSRNGDAKLSSAVQARRASSLLRTPVVSFAPSHPLFPPGVPFPREDAMGKWCLCGSGGNWGFFLVYNSLFVVGDSQHFDTPRFIYYFQRSLLAMLMAAIRPSRTRTFRFSPPQGMWGHETN